MTSSTPNLWSPSNISSIVGSVVECSPATRAARVRFPDDATFCFWRGVCVTWRKSFHFTEHFEVRETKERNKKKLLGGAGYRSRYLSHAKRALYHLSYAPCVWTCTCVTCFTSTIPWKYMKYRPNKEVTRSIWSKRSCCAIVHEHRNKSWILLPWHMAPSIAQLVERWTVVGYSRNP